MLTYARFFYDVLLLDQGSAVAPSGLVATVVAGPQVNLAWVITGITSEDHYSIKRRDVTLGEAFAEIATVAADVNTYAGDVGPFTTGHEYFYQIEVVGGPSDGEVSEVVSVFGDATVAGSLRRRRRD